MCGYDVSYFFLGKVIKIQGRSSEVLNLAEVEVYGTGMSNNISTTT